MLGDDVKAEVGLELVKMAKMGKSPLKHQLPAVVRGVVSRVYGSDGKGASPSRAAVYNLIHKLDFEVRKPQKRDERRMEAQADPRNWFSMAAMLQALLPLLQHNPRCVFNYDATVLQTLSVQDTVRKHGVVVPAEYLREGGDVHHVCGSGGRVGVKIFALANAAGETLPFITVVHDDAADDKPRYTRCRYAPGGRPDRPGILMASSTRRAGAVGRKVVRLVLQELVRYREQNEDLAELPLLLLCDGADENVGTMTEDDVLSICLENRIMVSYAWA